MSHFQDDRVDEELGHVVRSNWEREFASLLQERGIDYEYEGLIVQQDHGKMYEPDFVFPDRDAVVEIKGKLWQGQDTVRKAVRLREQYPDWTYIVVGVYLPSDYHYRWKLREKAVDKVEELG